MTVKRRCAKNMLPSGHIARKIPGAKGVWVIEVNLKTIIPSLEKPQYFSMSEHPL